MVDEIMAQAQVFASAWSLVGGRFDNGNMLTEAEEAKAELRQMIEALAQPAGEAAEAENERLRKAVEDVLAWRVNEPCRGDLRDNDKSRDALSALVKAMEAK